MMWYILVTYFHFCKLIIILPRIYLRNYYYTIYQFNVHHTKLRHSISSRKCQFKNNDISIRPFNIILHKQYSAYTETFLIKLQNGYYCTVEKVLTDYWVFQTFSVV